MVIHCADEMFHAELYGTPTAEAIQNALPIAGETIRWGDEIYFEIDVHCELESDARADVLVGELGYWPPGRALCILFGPTPVSTDDQPKAASPVNVFGRITDDVSPFKTIRSGERIERYKPTDYPNGKIKGGCPKENPPNCIPVSYTHLRAHET